MRWVPKRRASWLAAAALLSPVSPVSPAQAAQAIDLPRSSPWTFRYDADSCDMAAVFGADNRSLVITFSGFAPDEPFQITLAGEGMDWHLPEAEGWMDLGNGAQPRRVTVLSASGAHQASMLLVTEAELEPWISEGGNSTNSTLTFTAPSRISYRLGVSGFHDAMRVMRQCTENLELQWGFKPWEQRTRSRPEPTPGFKAWMRKGDHPEFTVPEGIGGFLRFRLGVDAEGHVTDCHIQRAIGPDSFGEQVCRQFVLRGRFIPAHDARGAPVASYFAGAALF